MRHDVIDSLAYQCPRAGISPRSFKKNSFKRVMATTEAAPRGIVSGCHSDQENKERKERQIRRWTAEMEELRAKLERDKQEALYNQKESMNRAFRVQLAKLVKEKEELVRKCQQQQAAKSAPAPAVCPVEVQRLSHENTCLRIDKKKQDEQLQLMKESEQTRFENMRSLLDDKARELNHLQKQLRQQIARLREETRAKDRVISTLEAELRVQTGRAQQFRDILEQNLFTGCGCRTSSTQSGLNNRDDIVVRERQLLIQVEDLREKMRQQQNNFTADKQELLRRLNDTEKQQSPLRKKTKDYLTRNVELAAKNTRLTETLKMMQQQHADAQLKRSITGPNVHQLGLPSPATKLSAPKLRKEPRFFSMWELPPLLEVDTDSTNDVSGHGSHGSLSPATTSSGVASCSSDAWSEETRRELEMLFSQLTREHSELQRSYQMLHEKLHQLTSFSEADAANVNYATLQADYSAARARIRDLEEILQLKQNQDGAQQRPYTPTLLEIQAKFVREKHTMHTQLGLVSHQLQQSRNKCQAVQCELNEARDQNELLEFRILELEELHERQPSSRCYDSSNRKDVCTDTDSDDISVGDSGITSMAVDCPSPTSSLHAGSHDGEFLIEKISAVKGDVQLLACTLNDPSHKTVLTQLQALLGVCQSRLIHVGKSSRNSMTAWDWPLQESGIFEEDHGIEDVTRYVAPKDPPSPHGDVSIQVTVPVEDTAQKNWNHREQAVQTISQSLEERSVQTQEPDLVRTDEGDEGVVVEKKTFQDQSAQSEEAVVSLQDLRDIEGYYVKQVEQLQKEKAALRKKIQSSRDETLQAAADTAVLTKQFEEREKQFEDILEKNCRCFEQELAMARNKNHAEVVTLKECIHLLWDQVRDFTCAPNMTNTSVVEFTQALASSLHSICSELQHLRGKVIELESMEQAFKTTLQQADGLVHHIEEKHLQRIRELEESLEQGLEPSIYISGQGSASLEAKIRELENENLSFSVQSMKFQELEACCHQLRKSNDELEQREKHCQLALEEGERRFNAREQRYREEVAALRTELEKYRESESSWQQRFEQKDVQLAQLKTELETEHEIITGLETDVKDLHSQLDKEDVSFRNEATKLRSQITISLGQLNELEFVNCQLREKVNEYQERVEQMQRNVEKESVICKNLMAENNKLQNWQKEMELRSKLSVETAKPLTQELLEVELGDALCVRSAAAAAAATLDDFREISLPNTPTVLDGCTNVFDEHFKVLESLENYLEAQQLVTEEAHDSGVSTSPSIHENEPLAAMEAQLLQLRTEKRFLLNSVVNSQKKDEIIQILINQLKYNAPRQYLTETAAYIRQMTISESNALPVSDREIERVCYLLEAPIDLADVCDNPQPADSLPKVVTKANTTKAKLPEEDPLLSPASDLRVTRKVGQDGLVIAWLPSTDSQCVGYLICVNGQESQRVRSAQRTKAVLCGLNLHEDMEICIYSLSADMLISRAERAFYSPDSEEPSALQDTAVPGSGPTKGPVPEPTDAITPAPPPREVVVQTFYTNSSVTVRSSRRVTAAATATSRIPVRSCVP